MTPDKKRWHLTCAERELIRTLTLRGVRQSVIARELKIGRQSVSRCQQELGLPTVPIIPEQKILGLFQQGWGGYRIARHLGIAVSAVYKIAHKNGFKRKDGIGYPEPHGDVAGFIEAIKNREDYVANLAAKFGLNPGQAQRIARKILGTVQFKPGASKPPLSSAFPQKYHDRHTA